MGELLAVLEGSRISAAMGGSRWLYAGTNTAHVLGIALLVGGIVPLDLRLLGLWRKVPLAPLATILTRTAATGLVLALFTGALLFAARPAEYASLGVFQAKIALVSLGLTSALAVHGIAGPRLANGSILHLRLAGLLSLTAWLGALIAGRMIAFAA